MNGIIYCRVSSKEQIEGTSLESQEQACREYARQKHIGVLKVFVEQGESAKFADRTQLLELIEFCRQNKSKVELLLVWKVDRFARNVADHYKIKAELQKYGVRIVSVTEPIDPNAEGRLMETILAGFAQFDNDIRAMRTVQGMRRKLQEGIHPWGPPLGYKSSTTNGEKKTQPDLPDEGTFKSLQRAWHYYATGAYTKAEIRRLLYGWGVSTRSSEVMPAQSIDNIFRNPYYAGILVDPWSKEEYQGLHIPLVSREIFERVQRVIAGRNRSVTHTKHHPEFPLRGFVRCASCERYLTGSFSRGRSRRYPYYRCGNHGCPAKSKSIPVGTVLDEFRALLSRIAPKPTMIEKLTATILRYVAIRERSAKAKSVRTRETLTQLDKELQELIRMRAQGLISDEDLLAHRRELMDRRACAETAIQELDFKSSELRKHLDDIAEPITRLFDTWSRLPALLRERFHRLILPVGFVAGKSGTAELGLLFSLLRPSDDGNSTVVHLTGAESNLLLQEFTALRKILQDYHEYQEESKSEVP